MKHALVLIALAIAGSVLAYFHVASQTYFPVVRLSSSDGFTYVVVQDADADRNACGEANDRFLEPVKKLCTQCKVEYARCDRELEGIELALSAGEPIPHHAVVGRGVRVAVQGPPDKVRAVCEEIASDIVRAGVPSAACVFPRLASKY